MSDEMTDERLAEIRQRADATTEGPWIFQPWGAQNQNGDYAESILCDEQWAWSVYGFPDNDGEFVAHARADVPALLAEVERLRGEVQRLESSKLLAASMMAEQFCGEEVARLREQVETLQAERDAMTEDYDCWNYLVADGHGWPADHRYSEAHTERCRKRWATPWVPVTEEEPTP